MSYSLDVEILKTRLEVKVDWEIEGERRAWLDNSSTANVSERVSRSGACSIPCLPTRQCSQKTLCSRALSFLIAGESELENERRGLRAPPEDASPVGKVARCRYN